MKEYRFTVCVEAEDPRHAVQVMCERTGYDERLKDRDGTEFDYWIDWSVPSGDQHDELVAACNIFYEEAS